jgi:hypothetical protein
MRALTRIVLWGLLFCFPLGATAQQRDKSVEIGVGLICNSEAQVQRYLALHSPDRSPDLAIQVVNTEAHDPTACSLASIAFVRGNESGAVQVTGGVMKIMRITVVAAQTPLGWQPVTGLVQFTAIFEKLDEA